MKCDMINVIWTVMLTAIDLTCDIRRQFLALILKARFTGVMQGIKTVEITVLWFVTPCSLVGKSFRVSGNIIVPTYTVLQIET
jgi:hypothetical protein